MKPRKLILFFPLYLGLIAAFFIFRRPENKDSPPRFFLEKGPANPVSLPQVLFTDVTGAAGIHFTHDAGPYGALLFPEMLGPGCGFFDFDNDNDQDLLIVNSGKWPHHEADPARPTVVHSLYRNDGQGRFVDIGKEAGLACRSYGQGVCFGDIDNDGFEDAYITCMGRNVMLRNIEGKRFQDITEQAGVECPEWSVSAAFVDYDRDGRLDLFVGNYVHWSIDVQQKIFLESTGWGIQEYPYPQFFEGDTCRLYRNLGGCRFQEVTREAGIHRVNFRGRLAAKALGVGVCDYDDDGWPDIAVANDQVPGFLFHNKGNGSFEEIASKVGIAADLHGLARAGMGIYWADYRNDGSIALAIGNFTQEMASLHISTDKERRAFTDIAATEGIGAATLLPVTWGLFFFDYDLDGRLDLFVLNGHTQESTERFQSVGHAQFALLFWNAGPQSRGGRFRIVPESHAGNGLLRRRVGRGCAYADIDGDGDLDIALTTNRGPASLLRNDGQLGHHYLRVKLQGHTSNRSAIGAKVRLRTGKIWQRREVTSGSSFASQNELILTFGLGAAEAAEEVEVTWPTGRVDRLTAVRAGQTLNLVEGQCADRPWSSAPSIPGRRF